MVSLALLFIIYLYFMILPTITLSYALIYCNSSQIKNCLAAISRLIFHNLYYHFARLGGFPPFYPVFALPPQGVEVRHAAQSDAPDM